jgi:fungalysin metallopeptidase (M36)/fungalysin/thermolysin propeptide
MRDAVERGIPVFIHASSSRSRKAFFFIIGFIAIASQFPIAAQIVRPAVSNEIETAQGFEPLPDFDARQFVSRRVQSADIEHKKRSLALKPAALDKVILRWNDSLDLPHSLLSLDAPLTQRSSERSETIARRFILDNAGLFALSQSDLDSSRVSALATDERAGLTRIALEQRANGIRVFDSEMLFALDRDGRVLSQSGSFIPRLQRRAPNSDPALTAEQALRRAALICGARFDSPIAASREKLPARERFVFSSEEVDSRTEASLVYYPVTRDDVRLAWQVLLYGAPTAIDAYLILIDAKTGEPLRRDSLTYALKGPQGRVFTKENPIISGDREMVSFDGDPIASPEGWVSSNRAEGNNAIILFNPTINSGSPIQANADGNFDFPIDLTPGHSPLNSSNASAANLFYWVNVAHDRFYALGFNESSHNFQANNFGKGGAGGDPVRAETLRGASLNQAQTSQAVRNNAFFNPTLDGTQPLLAMLLWNVNVDGQTLDFDSSYDAGVIIHEYTHGVSTRLAGTDNSIGLRSNQGSGMGEGWSDFFAMSFLSGNDKPLDAAVATGVYLTQRPRGVRAYPYSASFDADPLTFGDIRANTEIHAQGTVWCTLLWEMRQAFIERYGFDAGRDAVERLILNGLRATPLAPTFVDARDAILLADRASAGGANQDLIWRAFARRGLGKSASTSLQAGLAGFRIAATEGFDVPPEVSAGVIMINDRAGYPMAIGEPATVIVVDRDLLATPSIDCHVRNSRTGEDAIFNFQQSAPGRFTAVVTLQPPEASGGTGNRIVAQPGDEIVFTYANERNQSGAAETLEARVQAGRRVTLYSMDFEQEPLGWLMQGFWHLTSRRSASAAHSLYFAKKKGENERKSYTKAGSSGVAYSPLMDLKGLVKPQLEFDYYFSGLELPSDTLTILARNISFDGGSGAANDPTLPLTFDLRPDNAAAFNHSKIDLQYIGRSNAFVSFTFFASSADAKRKKLEGFYLDNVRLTAISVE